MACKRTAASDLNHENWNDEEEPEEAGTFVKASQEVLEKRVVKSARRRLPRSADGPTKSAFGSFTGFKTTPAPSSSPFSFLPKSNTTGNLSSITNPMTNSISNGLSKIPENGIGKTNVTASLMDSTSNSTEAKKTEQSEKVEPNIFKKSSDYYAKLKGLNESVTQWIKSHVDSNPFCILTPIFRDYERYLKDIEANHGRDSSKLLSNSDLVLEAPQATSSKLSSTPSTENLSSDSAETKIEKSTAEAGKWSNMDWNPKSSTSFGASATGSKSIFSTNTTDKTENKSIFGNINTENNPFLNKTASVVSNKEEKDKSKSEQSTSSGYTSFSQNNSNSATFSFGQSSNTSTTPSAGFSFGSSKPFSFGSHVAAPANTETKPDNEEKEDEDEPPKPDFKPITEEDAFFEKRCKVFVKKEGNFSDRGIGVLFLKSTPNGKTQLVVRADNSLGNLLLNTLLTTSIPTKRMNKNTVMLVCLPLPDSEPPPTPVLLRVKTSEDADNLIETLDSNKK